MSLFYPNSNLSVIPISRRLENDEEYGYDAEVMYSGSRFKPFYVQFKRPLGYPYHSTSSIVSERGRFYNVNNDSLYFYLKEHQHNTLYRHLEKIGIKPYVAYICPLFFNRQEYRKALIKSLTTTKSKKNSSKNKIKTLKLFKKSLSMFPIIHEHICIPPHDHIKGNHKYSFSSDGDKLFFHSPEKIKGRETRLDEWLISIADTFLKNEGVMDEENATGAIETREQIFHTAEKLNFEIPRFIRKSERYIDSWLWFGECLRKKYRIYQYGLFERNIEYRGN